MDISQIFRAMTRNVVKWWQLQIMPRFNLDNNNRRGAADPIIHPNPQMNQMPVEPPKPVKVGGEDAMAFEYGDGFILAGTNNLRNMLKERFGGDFMETKGYMKSYTVKYPMMVPEPYTIYKRNGRDDRIVLVRLDDVKKIGKIID